MNKLLIGFGFLVVFGGCSDEEKPSEDAQEQDDSTQDGETTSAYGSCSLDLVSASGMMFSALTIDASTVVVQLAFEHEEHGEQMEEHPLGKQEETTTSISWSLDLEQVSTPADVVLGQSTLWSGSVFDPIDKMFVARNSNDQVCDCWDVSAEYGRLNCETFEAEQQQ